MAALRLLVVALVATALGALVTVNLTPSTVTLDVPVIDLPSPAAPATPAAPDPDRSALSTATDDPTGPASTGVAPAVTISPPPVAHAHTNHTRADDDPDVDDPEADDPDVDDPDVNDRDLDDPDDDPEVDDPDDDDRVGG